MRGTLRGLWLALGVVVALLGSCSSGDNATNPGAAALDAGIRRWTPEAPPAPARAHVPFQTAQLGDLGVVVDSGRSPASVYLTRDDQWARLPDVPAGLDNAFIGVAEETLLATGTSCPTTVDMCEADGVSIAYRFDPAEREWRRLPLPPTETTGEGAVVIPTTNVDQSTGVISIGRELLAVGADGELESFDPEPLGSLRCVVNDRAVTVDLSPLGAVGTPPTATLEVGMKARAWRRAPPRGGDGVDFMVCGPTGPIFLGDSSEAIFDVMAGAWRERHVELPVHLDPQRTVRPRIDDAVVLPDGSLVATTGSRAVVRRTADGRWEDLEQYADVLLAAGDDVYVSSREDPGFHPLVF